MTTPTAWTRQRAALEAEIASAALTLFTERGFEAVTVDEIARTVGISRRSFFRYFGTKEDVLLRDLASRGDLIAAALRERPQSEDPWAALTAALRTVYDETRDPDVDLAIGRMMHRTPALRARGAEKRGAWLLAIAPVLAERLGGDDAELRARAVVGAALSCLDVASAAWVETDGHGDLAELFDRAVAAVRA